MRLLLALVAGFAASQLAFLATTVYLHRALAHRALTLAAPVSIPMRTIIWMSTGMKPREWAAVHRKHHAFTDTPDDPHSPAQYGWLRVQFANAQMYRRAANDGVTVTRYGKDMQPDRLDRWFFDHGFVGLVLGISVLVLLLGPIYGAVAAFFHLFVYVGLSGAVNAIGHHFGRRPYENSATNLQWLAFLVGGEGLHNNHHAAPTSARFSFHKGEIDLGWWAIKSLRRFGLAKVRLDRLVLKAKRGDVADIPAA